jgi:Flp pilus assembly pilin Flp
VQTLLVKLHLKLEELIYRTEGQDMVEYALVIGLLCLGVASSSRFLASSLATAFNNLNSTLTSYSS